MLKRTLENCCHLPQPATASINATWVFTLGERYTSILCSDTAGFPGPEHISDMCAVVRWVTSVSGKMDVEFLIPKTKGDHPDFHQWQMQNQTSVMNGNGGAAEQRHGWLAYVQRVPLTWRHILGLYRDIYCHQDDVFHGSPWLLVQDNARSHSACATTAWFCRHRVNVLDWPACSPNMSPIENIRPVMKRTIRQGRSQTAELNTKKICLQNFNN